MTTFPKADLADLTWVSEGSTEPSGLTLLRRRFSHETRWNNAYELIFTHDERFYRVTYEEGKTEYQDAAPFEYDPDPVPVVEVRPVERVVVDYEPVA